MHLAEAGVALVHEHAVPLALPHLRRGRCQGLEATKIRAAAHGKSSYAWRLWKRERKDV